jgi:mannose-6-phosphate isomerase-like protein (cupin superfamily)
MKIIRASDKEIIPASHEDPKNPGVLKKILLQRDDLIDARIQMINWAFLKVGKSFQLHYHEDMQEVFIMLCGKVKMVIDDEEETLYKGDTVIIPVGSKHTMTNIGQEDAEYMAIGVAKGKRGKTIAHKY